MQDFLTDLFCTLTEDIAPPRGNPEYNKATQDFEEIEKQIKEKIGLDLLTKYQRAQFHACRWEEEAIFLCGLRFGAQFMLEIFSR